MKCSEVGSKEPQYRHWIGLIAKKWCYARVRLGEVRHFCSGARLFVGPGLKQQGSVGKPELRARVSVLDRRLRLLKLRLAQFHN
jgi:hypothetical protein